MSRTRSYWQAAAAPYRSEADVVIAGAGITGASTAFWLHRLAPGLRVALLDASSVAAGASGRNAGFLLRGTAMNPIEASQTLGADRARWHHQFTARSIRQMMEAVPLALVHLDRTGSLLAAGDPSEDAALKAAERVLQEWGDRVAYWTQEEVQARLPVQGFYGGLYDPEGASIDPVRLVQYLAGASGAVVHAGHRVMRIEPGGSRFDVLTSRGAFRAPVVLLTLNAYLPQVLGSTASLIRPVRAQMLAARTSPSVHLPHPIYSDRGYFYARSAPNGTLLMGGARHLHEEEEVGYDDHTTPALQADLEAYVRAHFPTVERLRVLRRWSGTMGFSPDGLPFVGRTPEGVLWAGGFTGHGMAFAFGIGRLLARLALAADDEGEAAWFDPRRLNHS